MSIYLIKLVNDDEIIGEVDISEYEGVMFETFRVIDPLLVTMIDDEYGQSLSLTRYLPYSKLDYVHLNKNVVICVSELNDDMIEYYDLSMRYCQVFSDKSYVKNLRSAINHLDKTLYSTRNDDKLRNSDLNQEMVKKMIFLATKPASDSIN